MRRAPPTSTLFPYTTLFRSRAQHPEIAGKGAQVDLGPGGARQRGQPGSGEAVLDRRLAQLEDPLPSRTVNPTCLDRKSTRLNSSHMSISYAVFCLKKKKTNE